jgi:hypothetical protein
MYDAIDPSLPIKKAIDKRLQKRGVLTRIERKIKLGMMVAFEELRENPDAPGNLDRRKFRDAPPSELRALQLVYNFLAERNLSYTLSALLEESATVRASEPTDILDVLRTAPVPRRADQTLDDDEYAIGSDRGFESPTSKRTFH